MNELDRMYARIAPPDQEAVDQGRRRLLAAAGAEPAASRRRTVGRRVAARLATGIRPEKDGERPDEHAGRAPRHWAHRYAPIAVAVAVILIVTLGIIVSPGRDHRPASPPSITPTVVAPAAYFIVNVQGVGVSVRDAHTGRVAATVKPPADTSWTAVSATADPHVFYLAAQASDVRLYRLGIDGAGRVGSLSPVATVQSGAADLVSLAATPDGGRVAYPVMNLGTGAYGPAEIDVLDLSANRRTIFRTTVTGRVSNVSWAADGRHLAYQLDGSTNHSDGVWILDTHAGRDLTAASHSVFRWQPAFVGDYTNPVLSADGRHVYLIAVGHGRGGKTTQIVELDAGTGRRQRVLYEQPYISGGNAQWAFTEFARDPAGKSLLVVDEHARAHRVDIATGRVVKLQFTGGIPNALAW